MSQQPGPDRKSPSVVVLVAVLGALLVIAIVVGSIVGAKNQNPRAAGPVTPGATASP